MPLFKNAQLYQQSNMNQYKFNPIVKHTYNALPLIYGSNGQCKKNINNKFNVKSKYSIQSLKNSQQIQKRQNNFQTPNKYLKEDKLNYQSSSYLKLNQRIQKNISQIRDTTMKINKNHQYQISKKFQNNKKTPNIKTQGEQKQEELQPYYNIHINNLRTVTNKQLNGVNIKNQKLSKPRQKCNSRYCYCKSFYDQYQQEIYKLQRKFRNKLVNILSNKNKNLRNKKLLQCSLPKINNGMNKGKSQIDSRYMSQQKIKSRYGQNQEQPYYSNQKGKCNYCLSKQNNKNKNKNNYKRTISQLNNFNYIDNQNILLNNGKKTSQFRYLQSNQNIHCQLQNQKPLEKKINRNNQEQILSLSNFKQIYKSNKKPNYRPKYTFIQTYQEKNSEDRNNASNKKLFKNFEQNLYQISPKNRNINCSQHNSQLSEKFLAEHLMKALKLQNGSNNKTFFSKLKKKQQESDNESNDQVQKLRSSKDLNRKKKNVKLINQNDLFTIPQQEEYIDYLKSYEPILKDFKIKDLIQSQKFRIIKYKDSVYFGEVDESKNNKDKKEIQIKDGKALEITSKQIFEGIYKNGIKTSGCQRNIDGIYIGQFVNGKRHGQGKFYWNNGQTFQGQWELGTKNGFGIWISPKGDYYQGQWKLNRQHGKGIYNHKNSIYQGQFCNFLKNGFGKQNFKNGDEYLGQYKDGKPHGKGKYIWKNGAIYQGQFYNGLRQGNGVWHQNDKVYYQGSFKNDFKHGNGKQFYKNGDTYSGQFVMGKKTKGIYKQILTGKQIQITDKINS